MRQKALASVDKRGVPVNTILVSALVTALCVLINYLALESAFRTVNGAGGICTGNQLGDD